MTQVRALGSEGRADSSGNGVMGEACSGFDLMIHELQRSSYSDRSVFSPDMSFNTCRRTCVLS